MSVWHRDRDGVVTEVKKAPGMTAMFLGLLVVWAGLVRGAPGHGAVGVAEDVLGDILEAECELDSRRGRCHGRRGRADVCAIEPD